MDNLNKRLYEAMMVKQAETIFDEVDDAYSIDARVAASACEKIVEEHAIEFEDWIDKNAFIKGFGDNRNNWYRINGDFVGTTKNLYQLFTEQLNNLP